MTSPFKGWRVRFLPRAGQESPKTGALTDVTLLDSFSELTGSILIIFDVLKHWSHEFFDDVTFCDVQ